MERHRNTALYAWVADFKVTIMNTTIPKRYSNESSSYGDKYLEKFSYNFCNTSFAKNSIYVISLQRY